MMADMQRARLIAGELPKFGWEAEILAPDASFQTDFSRLQGAGLEFPDVPLHEVRQWHPGFFRRIGSRNVGIRAAVPIRRHGLAVLQSRRFDLVYFSTTQHWLTCNGAYWRRKTGVPYIADLHDPVYLEKKVYFVSRHHIKERIARRLGKSIERLALGRADGLVSVSQGYVDDLSQRQPHAPWLHDGCTLVQPFAADLSSLDAAPHSREGGIGIPDIVYIGAGGNIMEKGWREFVNCLAAEQLPPNLQVHLLGTDTNWLQNRRRYLQDIADASGLRGIVHEDPARISYMDSMSRSAGASGLLVLGVDDRNYRPSKLQTCLATGLPLLAIVHADSELGHALGQCGPGIGIVRFGAGESGREENRAAVRKFLADAAQGRRWNRGERSFLRPQEAAAGHAALFERVVASRC